MFFLRERKGIHREKTIVENCFDSFALLFLMCGNVLFIFKGVILLQLFSQQMKTVSKKTNMNCILLPYVKLIYFLNLLIKRYELSCQKQNKNKKS